MSALGWSPEPFARGLKPEACSPLVTIFINRNGLRWCDAAREYGPPKTLYNRWKRWGDKGIFARMMQGLASEAAVPKTVMIDATYLKAHRTASSLRSKKGGATTSADV